jgi:hypothetical protein
MKASMGLYLTLLSSVFTSSLGQNYDVPELPDISDECLDALAALQNNTEISGAQSMFVEDLIIACAQDGNEKCSVNIGMTGVDVSMDACAMTQLGKLQETCEAFGNTFCSMTGAVDAGVKMSQFQFEAPVSIKPSCIGMCIPPECNPEDLEQLSPFNFTVDYVNEAIVEYLGPELGAEIKLNDITVSGSFDCLEEGASVEEKGSLRG